ncbi:hypothetical protein BDV93DRAFT_518438, partial [Ceratobasidium sp. AG-I]
MPTNQEAPALEDAHTVDQVKSYVFRTDAIAPCCVSDVRSVRQASKDIEVYWLGTVPCRTIRLVGVLISATEYESRSIYLLDDGTGTINCLKMRSSQLKSEELAEGSAFYRSRAYDIGDTVSVIGKIETYRETRQVYVASIQRCVSQDAESRHLLDVLEQHRTRYSQPFVIPPLPSVPVTPRKHRRAESQSNYASSMASTPTTTAFSSPIKSPAKSPKKNRPRLRHPSRLRSKDLNENVFRIYVSHVLISTLSLPEASPADTTYSNSPSENIDNSTPRPSRTRSVINVPDSTPKRAPRAQVDIFGSPTPKKPVAQYQLPSLPAETSGSGPVLGVTLSYLRRVQVLADLARRVVDQAAHERDKVLRHAEKGARAKYEASLVKPQPENKSGAERSKAGSTARSSKSSSRATSSAVSSTPTEPSSTASTRASHSTRSTSQKHSQASSSHTSTSAPKAKHARTEPLTPTETARRAAYHAKQDKLHAEDVEKRSARTKRLFEAALRALVSEGEIALHEGPKRAVPTSSRVNGMGKRALSGLWTDVTNTTTGSSGRSLSAASSVLSGMTCSDLDASEDDKDTPDLSDPSDSEDAYIPITPHTLRPALLAALRQSLMRRRGGVDVESWTKTLRGDEQWARVSDLAVKEALEILVEEEWVTKVGGGRWDFTRGSWAKSLTMS